MVGALEPECNPLFVVLSQHVGMDIVVNPLNDGGGKAVGY